MPVKVVSEKVEWRDTLDAFDSYDFVHTYAFHKASADNGEGTPIMFVLDNKSGDPILAWPTLRREIPGTNHFDLTSVYGYGGPILLRNIDSSAALNTIGHFMGQYGAVSLFSRMHPLFIGQIHDESMRGQRLGDVVVIDVEHTQDVLSEYRGGHRREIVKSRAYGVTTSVDATDAHLADFLQIYRSTMTDLHAAERYHFSDRYFGELIKSNDFKTFLAFAELNGKKIGASMFIVTGRIMQYYLSGTVREFRKLAPSKVIIAKAHELAVELGVTKLVLGGGIGSARDSLFKFKSGFSSLTMPFYVTKQILNDSVYRELCGGKADTFGANGFFPAYRA